jgi:glycosyltransferase involved in cell wall biosynthesis
VAVDGLIQMTNPSIRIVAVIPAYNNEGTISDVVSQVRRHIADIIAVNDSSTDRTGAILKNIPLIRLIELPRNQGKGAALQAAFARALEMGFTHAITIDADGQYSASDIPAFHEKIHQAPDTLWIGNRILTSGTTRPVGSRGSRKFSAFWYHFFTGLHITDTQCGFRAYPLKPTVALECKTQRVEFEAEVITKAAWDGIPVRQLPVHLHFQSGEKAGSHFRLIGDFLRISRLNLKFALTKIFLPFKTMDIPGKTVREKIHNLIKQELKANTTPFGAALSLASGVFFGILPFYGFQVFLLLTFSFIFKINRPLALLSVNVSPLPVIPFYIAAGVYIGNAVLPKSIIAAIDAVGYSKLLQGGIAWFVGSWILAFVAGGVVFGISYGLLSWRIKE